MGRTSEVSFVMLFHTLEMLKLTSLTPMILSKTMRILMRLLRLKRQSHKQCYSIKTALELQSILRKAIRLEILCMDTDFKVEFRFTEINNKCMCQEEACLESVQKDLI